ncbi:VPS37B subunit of ESCRT-I a isoform X2 [Gouania willdenowi]|uniref:VPS37B subunit of ESCRT-I a isoform X2 n=1 Tax=Gouania willdenowi TaxID=441366 RepID=UPI00105636AE|nr:vacuolar protein sorting-associated protein 37B isoform X2 [Gouania willdenowi]
MSTLADKFGSYTMTQLNEVLEDDDKLTKMIQDLDEGVQQSKERTLANNRILAEQNLALQPRLEHKKEQLTKIYSSLQESFESFQLRKSTLDHKSGNTSLDILLALLQAEGAKIEEETENMADSFLDGDMTLDSFIDSYQSKRKLAHLRRVKIEKLQEMVMKGQSLPQVSVPPSRSQDVSAAAVLTDSGSNSPVPQPRRKPPAPPSQPPPSLNPVPVPTLPSQPPTFYAASPYPPIPPRTGQPYPNVSGYPSPYLSQYPPALPDRPPPRMAPHPGFIMQ